MQGLVRKTSHPPLSGRAEAGHGALVVLAESTHPLSPQAPAPGAASE